MENEVNKFRCGECSKFRHNGGGCMKKVAGFNEACEEFVSNTSIEHVMSSSKSTIDLIIGGVSSSIEHIRLMPESPEKRTALCKLHRVRDGLNTVKGIIEE